MNKKIIIRIITGLYLIGLVMGCGKGEEEVVAKEVSRGAEVLIENTVGPLSFSDVTFEEKQEESYYTFDYYVNYVKANMEGATWVTGFDESNNSIWLELNELPFNLTEAKLLLNKEDFKGQWLTFTNEIFKTAQMHAQTLKSIGFKGDFKMIVLDNTGNIIFMALEGLWGDSVYHQKGKSLR